MNVAAPFTAGARAVLEEVSEDVDTPRPFPQGLLVQASARQLDPADSEAASAVACVEVVAAATVVDSTEADSAVDTAAVLAAADTNPTAGEVVLLKAHLPDLVAEDRVGMALVGMEAATEDTAAGTTTEIAAPVAATGSLLARDATTAAAATVTATAMVGMAGTETTILASAATKATATATRGGNAASSPCEQAQAQAPNTRNLIPK